MMQQAKDILKWAAIVKKALVISMEKELSTKITQ
jgi:hypothetical protein